MAGNIKTIVSVPGWADTFGQSTGKVTKTSDAYSYVPLLYRALQLRCGALSSVPLSLYNGENVIDWPYAADLKSLIWKTQAALLLSGAAYWVKLRNRVKTQGVQWVNPTTMQVDYKNGQITFKQNATGGQKVWGMDEMVYFREFNPVDDIQPGVSAAAVALGDAQMMRYMNLFAGTFFESGAMPLMVVSLETGSQDDIKKAEGFFQRAATGVKNAFRVLGVRSGVSTQVITPPLKDLAMPELQATALHNISLAFGIPQTMLEDAANYATATEHRMSFWQDTIRPAGEAIAAVITEQLFGGKYLAKFEFDTLDIFQEDEAQRSGSLLNLINAGLPTIVALDLLGYELSEEQRALIESVEEEAPDKTENVVEEEMAKWMRKAIKAHKAGKSADVEFITDKIPEIDQARIHVALAGAKSLSDIESAFKSGDNIIELIAQVRAAKLAVAEG